MGFAHRENNFRKTLAKEKRRNPAEWPNALSFGQVWISFFMCRTLMCCPRASKLYGDRVSPVEGDSRLQTIKWSHWLLMCLNIGKWWKPGLYRLWQLYWKLLELVGEQGIVVLGENLACIRIILYCSTKFVYQPTHKALFFIYYMCISTFF